MGACQKRWESVPIKRSLRRSPLSVHAEAGSVSASHRQTLHVPPFLEQCLQAEQFEQAVQVPLLGNRWRRRSGSSFLRAPTAGQSRFECGSGGQCEGESGKEAKAVHGLRAKPGQIKGVGLNKPSRLILDPEAACRIEPLRAYSNGPVPVFTGHLTRCNPMIIKVVGLARFELTTSCTPCKRTTKLCYSPRRFFRYSA
ncbi:MAG: hypothetical protein JWM59_1890 [Verrucomicrobiales bacterium]|nr:hypothetical protein [Verrucomicrobiales bacterium]